MKRTIAILLMVTCLVGSTSASLVVNTGWGAEVSAAYLYEIAPDLTRVLLDPENFSYRIELVIDINNDTDMLALIGDGTYGFIGLPGDTGWDHATHGSALDDIIFSADVRTWEWAGDDGLGYIGTAGSQIPEAYSGANFYFRWFNADTQENATQAGIIYGAGGSGNQSGWTIGSPPPAPPNPAVRLDYDEPQSLGSAYTGGAIDGWQTVQPVPEPGTIGLFLIGAGVLAYRKRRQDKA